MARSSRRSASGERSQKVRICWVFICELEKMGLAADFAVGFAAFGLGIQRDGEADVLAFAGGQDAGANLGRAFGGGAAAQLLILHGGDLDVDVDAVQQRAGDLGDVALDHGRGTHALARLVVEVAAGAWVHGGGRA